MQVIKRFFKHFFKHFFCCTFFIPSSTLNPQSRVRIMNIASIVNILDLIIIVSIHNSFEQFILQLIQITIYRSVEPKRSSVSRIRVLTKEESRVGVKSVSLEEWGPGSGEHLPGRKKCLKV